MILNSVKLFHNIHQSQSHSIPPHLAWYANKWILNFQCYHFETRMTDRLLIHLGIKVPKLLRHYLKAEKFIPHQTSLFLRCLI